MFVSTKMCWFRVMLPQVIILLLLISPADQCGTGRGGWRRRSSRKMTPLVFRQYIPNVPENTLGASGLTEGKITRNDEKFKDLVVNYNPDIVFKDEENTGADRIMTQRCKDKLNTLAISVENNWPGVKLRVTEAWDEQEHHAKDSLHYEGRAVDVTTSDHDRAKYGMLARLAVEAGFDYVFYESRGHIHASVKSDSSIASNYGGCFMANDTVQFKDGSTQRMSELKLGDEVLAIDSHGQLIYSPVILFFHQTHNQMADFLTIQTEHGRTISLTPNHLIYFTRNNITKTQDLSASFAMNAHSGYYLYVTKQDLQISSDADTTSLKAERITGITQHRSKGFYAPLTKHGTILVNDIFTSCYAHINHHSIAHTCLAPIRWWHSLMTFFSIQHLNELLYMDDGSGHIEKDVANVHWYAEFLHSLAPYFIPSYLLYNS